MAGGGLCGLLAGILTAGLTMIGIGFLPLGVDMAGYKPLTLDVDGSITKNEESALLIPVDKIASRFFERLSDGCFFGGSPLSDYMPDLARLHVVHRLRGDPDAMISAKPKTVELDECFVHNLPIQTLPAEMAVALVPLDSDQTHKLVVIETLTEFAVPPFDTDNVLRIPPSQVRLLTRTAPLRSLGRTTAHAPVAMVNVDDNGERHFVAVNRPDVFLSGSGRPQRFGWVFVVPDSDVLTFLLFRHLRVPVPQVDAHTETRKLVFHLGNLAPIKPEDADETEQINDTSPPEETPEFRPRVNGVKTGTKPDKPLVTAALPKVIHKDKAHLAFRGQKVAHGVDRSVFPPNEFIPYNERIESIDVPPNQGSVRIRLTLDQVNSLYGSARALAANLGPVFLRDTTNRTHAAQGYVLLKPDGTQSIHFELGRLIERAVQLPKNMRQDDELYLYFFVPTGIFIEAFEVGQTQWQIEPPLRVR